MAYVHKLKSYTNEDIKLHAILQILSKAFEKLNVTYANQKVKHMQTNQSFRPFKKVLNTHIL